ncbi:MAG: trypsin-like peptidase domain-containing protein [Clostridia bacterium]|nr:trypsin-like peptidase domain-containing protein [Clostridia bacterium]
MYNKSVIWSIISSKIKNQTEEVFNMSDYIYTNFSDNGNNFHQGPPPKKSGAKIAIITLICVFSILMSGFFGVLIGVAFAPDGEPLNEHGTVYSYLYEAPTIQNTGNIFTPDQLQNGGFLTIAQTASYASPTVVEITTEYVVQSYYNYITGGAGSGVIIGEYKLDGVKRGYYIVTNAHVIQTNNGSIVSSSGITVTTSNGKDYPVKNVVGYDIQGDIAVLMVETDDVLQCAVFGNSDTLILGQDVVAIGNPLGELGGTVTNGIISALDREINVEGNMMNLLQTNAAINPGNSGGGLFNLRGELIGVVNAKSSGTGIEGLGFAIPSNDAKKIVTDLIEHGYVKGRPFVGIALYMDNYSKIRVHSLTPNHNEGVLQQHDIILEANRAPLRNLNDFTKIVQESAVGDTISLKINRNGTEMNVNITVFEKKSS